MTKISNSKYVSILTKLLVLLVMANILSLILLWYLPENGVDVEIHKDYHTQYIRVDFKNMLNAKNSDQTASISGINNMILKGLYGNEDRGFVIIAMKSSPTQTSVVAVGESFQGYTLKAIKNSSVIFYKNDQEYLLNIQTVVVGDRFTSSPHEEERSTFHQVSRSDITSYIKNPAEIWKSISIEDVKEGATLKGFRVTRIDPNSQLATLGLKKGDIIIKVNNKVLKTYNDVFGIYNNIDKLDAINLVVQRNNQEVELTYEIN